MYQVYLIKKILQIYSILSMHKNTPYILQAIRQVLLLICLAVKYQKEQGKNRTVFSQGIFKSTQYTMNRQTTETRVKNPIDLNRKCTSNELLKKSCALLQFFNMLKQRCADRLENKQQWQLINLELQYTIVPFQKERVSEAQKRGVKSVLEHSFHKMSLQIQNQQILTNFRIFIVKMKNLYHELQKTK